MAVNASEIIEVALAGRDYDVVIEPGILTELPRAAAAFLPTDPDRPVAIVTDGNVERLYRDTIDPVLAKAALRAQWFVVEPGEAAKSWPVLERLCDWLLNLGITRSDHVVAFGGGVVGDLTGFACAILKRGCGFVQIPTTLLAQVDSSVGGKTAINVSAGKNLIGAFHQPSAVLIDPTVLDTLPDREMRAGYAEVVKYGLIGDRQFIDWLESNGARVLSRDPDALSHAIATSIRAKAAIVASDERELSGVRALLNLGHTFGHALEAETGFGDALLHGEAVSLGMVLAARFSARRGDLSIADAQRVAALVERSGLPGEIAALSMDCDGSRLVEHMAHDKKMEGATLPFVLLRGLGDAYLARDVELEDVAEFLDEQLRAH